MTRTAAVRTSLLSFACSAWMLAACTPAPTPTPDTASAQPEAAAGTDAPASDEAGFVPLFDGATLAGWHLYRKPGAPVSGWSVVDDVLTRTRQAAT